VTGRFLAVDAGNSKTVAVVVDAGGGVLGRARGGRGDIYNAVTPHAAAEAVIGSIRGALAEAGVEPAGLRATALRLAGVDWPEDAVWWRDRLAADLPGLERFSIANDGFASLRLGMLDGVGLAITVGTGPAVAGRSRDGRECCSGWMVFDHLGGAGLADAAVRAVCLAWMGIGPSTTLTPALLGLFGVADPYELRHVFTRLEGRRSSAEVLGATRSVLEVAGSGDPVAAGIVADHARAFVGYTGWVAAQVGGVPGPDLPIVLNGSVATSEHDALREALCAELATAHPDCPVSVSDAPPLAGCVLDALAEGGVELTAELRDGVIATYHPPEFLTT
jgi:N-acetylglucosamine kinase-like BadF-type ATPase